jgi:hypothetical protein
MGVGGAVFEREAAQRIFVRRRAGLGDDEATGSWYLISSATGIADR